MCDRLRYTVPARFVDAAALPLVVDPLIGSLLPSPIPAAAAPNLWADEVDIAGGAASSTFKAVWNECFWSYYSSQLLIVGRMRVVDRAGMPTGNQNPVLLGVPGYELSPRVATLPVRGLQAMGAVIRPPFLVGPLR